MSKHTLIAPSTNGFLMLAERIDAGVQSSIENFINWAEAQSWCVKHRVRAKLEMEGLAIDSFHLLLLQVLATRGVTDLQSLARCIPGSSSGCRSGGHTSVGGVRTMASHLDAGGLVQLTRDGKKVGAWTVSLTDAGRKITDQVGAC